MSRLVCYGSPAGQGNNYQYLVVSAREQDWSSGFDPYFSQLELTTLCLE